MVDTPVSWYRRPAANVPIPEDPTTDPSDTGESGGLFVCLEFIYSVPAADGRVSSQREFPHWTSIGTASASPDPMCQYA